MPLEDPKTIRRLWVVFLAVLVALVIADFFVQHHPHFGFDDTPAFGAWYGFLSCIVMVIGSKKLIGLFLQRKDTYYDD